MAVSRDEVEAVTEEINGLGYRLQQLRGTRGYQTASAASKALFPTQGRTTWTAWEDGTSTPPVRQLAVIAKTWNTSLDWLILGKETQ